MAFSGDQKCYYEVTFLKSAEGTIRWYFVTQSQSKEQNEALDL